MEAVRGIAYPEAGCKLKVCVLAAELIIKLRDAAVEVAKVWVAPVWPLREVKPDPPEIPKVEVAVQAGKPAELIHNTEPIS